MTWKTGDVIPVDWDSILKDWHPPRNPLPASTPKPRVEPTADVIQLAVDWIRAHPGRTTGEVARAVRLNMASLPLFRARLSRIAHKRRGSYHQFAWWADASSVEGTYYIDGFDVRTGAAPRGVREYATHAEAQAAARKLATERLTVVDTMIVRTETRLKELRSEADHLREIAGIPLR